MRNKSFPIVLILLGLIPLIGGFFGCYNFVLDLFSHFRIYYLLYFVLLFLLSFLVKNSLLRYTSGIIAAIIFFSVLKLYIPVFKVKTEIDSQEEISLCSVNLFSGNNEYQKVLKYLSESEFDILILQELTPAWNSNLSVLDENYPFSKSLQLNSNFGIGIKSKIPFNKIEFKNFSQLNVPTLQAQMEIGNEKLTIIGTHPVPPTNMITFRDRNNQFRKINNLIRETEGQVLLAGDLNCTTWSPNFSLLTEKTNLADSRMGFGIQCSWWEGNSLISIPIDHIFVSEGIQVVESKVGKNIGSDHLPKEIRFKM